MMKKILIFCGLIIGLMNSAQAQPTHGQMPDLKEMAKKSTESMAAKLKLSPDQKTKLLVILINNNEQIAKAMNDTHGDQMAMGSAASKIMTATDLKITSILNDSQKRDFINMKQARQAKMQGQH
jgi:hypothetical protein